MFPYDLSFQPPVPALYIEAISPSTSVRRNILAKLDTGADETIIPEDLAADLNLLLRGQSLTFAFDNSTQLYLSYTIDLLITGHNFIDLEVTAAPITYILLGRDVLNEFVITLDGPQRMFTIS
ncbi:MAG: hypothetical protein HC828_16425 [Blastochloris sp.]|nr:hypothetical protein [Blastochloris sp.]